MSKDNKLLISNSLILVILIVFASLLWDENNPEWYNTISSIAFPLALYHILIIKIKKLSVFDFIPWYILLCQLFLFGRVYVKALGYSDSLFWDSVEWYSYLSCSRAGLFSLCTLQALFLGAISTVIPYRIQNKAIGTDETNPRVGIIGIILFFISLPFKIYYDSVQIATQQISGGYVAVSTNIDGITIAFSTIPIVGLILILTSNKLSKRTKFLFFFGYYTYAAIEMVLAGDRRQFVISSIASFLLFVDLYKIKIRKTTMLIITILGYLALITLAAIRTGRQSVLSNIDDFIDVFSVMSEENIIIQTMSEFGLTFYSVVGSVEFFPSRFDFIWGGSFVAMIIVLIPGILSKLPWLSQNLEISKKIKSVYDQGFGGSIPQDLYANFYVGGIGVAIIVGRVIGKLMSLKPSKLLGGKARYFILFYYFMNLARSSFYEVLRPIVYSYIFIFILDKILKYNKR